MSNIRKEYSEYKHFKEQIFKEAAEAWTEENVILINERLNRNAIYRLNSALQRFDSKFGPYRNKLPTISKILNDAENGLHLVITGKIGSRSAAHMLQRMGIMYNILSDFFSGDLKSLLKTPSFRISLNHPDMKINEITEEGHDLRAIRRALAAALKPSDQERMLFRRAYKSFDMPTLDWNMAAKELCCLSCNDLKDLAGVERIPMVVVDDNQESAEGLDEAGAFTTVAGSLIGGTAAAGVKGASNFAKTFQKHGEQMGQSLTALEKIIYGIPELSSLKVPMTNLRKKSQQASSTRSGIPSLDLSAGARGAMMHPTVVIWKQAIMVLESFDAILKAWDETIEGNYKESGITKDNLQNLKKELTNAVKGDMFSKIARTIMGGVKPFPGLSPNDIVNAFMKVASAGVESGAAGSSAEKPEEEQKPVKESFEYNTDYHSLKILKANVESIILAEDYQALKGLIDKLKTFETSPQGKTEDAVTNDLKKIASQSSSGSADTTKQKEKQDKASNKTVPDPSKTAETEAAKENDIASEDIDTAIGAVTRATEQEIGKDRLDALNKAIADLQIPNVNDATSASKFLTTYKSLLTKDIEIGQLINILASNVQQSGNIQEQRSIAINIIKRIILEQPISLRTAEAEIQQKRAPERELEKRINRNPMSKATIATNKPKTLTTKPVEVTANSLKQAATNANTVEKNPQAVSAVDSQIKALEIPGINDVASVVKFVNDYISVVGKMKEIKELLAMLKNVSDVKKYPKVAEQTQATTTTSSAPASTQTSVGTAGTTT